MQLRKSGTFTSPTSISTDFIDLDHHLSMPRRSPTCTDSLLELLPEYQDQRIQDPRIKQIADKLDKFARTLAGHKASVSNCINDSDVHPVPDFFLTNTSMAPMKTECKPSLMERNPHDHASDSGLGSSLSGSKLGKDHCSLPVLERPLSDILKDEHRAASTSVTTSHSAITQSFSGLTDEECEPVLGDYARRQIQDGILDPILADETLKNFHEYIESVPQRMLTNAIKNLRDLEKEMVFLAPKYSATPASYFNFCERSIRLLMVTVERLPERDQRLPTDRPYTTNYFADLMQQIRRMAAIMAATKRKEANGEDLDEMDYSRDEKITLRGGMGVNGRPAELVREKNGKVIPLAEGAADVYSPFSSSKRGLTDDELDDEAARRSMARRRKSEKPGDVMHACRECKKEFKRPCDLTKHEKTHSRPWKCPKVDCRYHKLGWPTEKECDRHFNDKHADAPPQHHCLYEGCTYVSKRESNCKQHMEKAHGWTYERSKSNGKKKAPAAKSSGQVPPTPPTPFSGTPAFATPVTPYMVSPYEPTLGHDFGFGTPALSNLGYEENFRRESLTTTEGSVFTHSSGQSPFDQTSFDNAVTPEDMTFNHSDMLNCGNVIDFNTGFQQPTPAMSIGYDQFDQFTLPVNNMSTGMSHPHLSPGAQPDLTLYSPEMAMHVDEGFNEPMMNFNERPTGDFALYDNTMSNNMDLGTSGDFFPDLNQLGGQFDNNTMNLNNTSLFADQSMCPPFDEFMGNYTNQQ
jgi:hypothetical protein